MKPHQVVAGFDSATAMLSAVADYNAGTNSPTGGEKLGAADRTLAALAGVVNQIPRPLKEKLYAFSGWYEATQAHKVGEIRSDELAEWIVRHHPRKQADVAFIGSANGALTHLAAALEAPWLPQTLLLPVRRHGVPPEDGQKDLDKMRSTGQKLLEANPDWRLHHMHDPNQDRLMVSGMCYFRVKWLRLPEVYRRYLRRTLTPGATLVVSDCAMRWPTTRVDDRYVFQQGGFGGATLSELHDGGERVREYLRIYDSDYSKFIAPEPDGESPEAEWGFAEELMEDLQELADEEGWNLVRLRYEEPETLSAPVADMYREWYRKRGLPTNRLLVESFMLVEPYWALRSGSVPFWTVFNKEPSLRALEEYLDHAPDYEEIRMGLFSHGVESVGLARADEWRGVLDRATKTGSFLGTDPSSFPRDFAVLFRFREELSRVRGRQPMPVPMEWSEAADALRRAEQVELVGAPA